MSVFPYLGGKGRQSEWFPDKMPLHDTYVEVFGGAGELLYNKPGSQNEIYNDLNNDLTQFFTVFRPCKDDLVEWLQAVPYSRSLYNDWIEGSSKMVVADRARTSLIDWLHVSPIQSERGCRSAPNAHA